MRTCVIIGTMLIFVVSCVVGSNSAAEKPPEVQKDVSSAFEQKYLRWKSRIAEKMTFSQRVKSTLPASVFYDNEEFEDIVELGIPAIPCMIQKLHDDRRLRHALYRITKWKYNVRRSGQKPSEYVWTVEEFPDIREKGGPPDSREIWLRWWREGPKFTAERFAMLYRQWNGLKKDGKEEEAAGLYQRLKDLGIAALPHMIKRLKEGDTDLIPAISYLTDSAVNEDATAAECVEWWEENKDRWTIPFPEPEGAPRESIETGKPSH